MFYLMQKVLSPLLENDLPFCCNSFKSIIIHNSYNISELEKSIKYLFRCQLCQFSQNMITMEQEDIYCGDRHIVRF